MNNNRQLGQDENPDNTYDRIGSLLAAVKEAGGQVPARFFPATGIDVCPVCATARLDLDEKIGWAFSVVETMPDHSSKTVSSRRRAALGSIETHLREAVKMLENDQLLLVNIEQNNTSEVPTDIVEMLNVIVNAVNTARLTKFKSPVIKKEDLKFTPQERLYIYLAKIFEAEMETGVGGAVLGTIRTYDNHRGPFPAFVLDCLRLYGDKGMPPPTPAALTKALKRSILKI